MIHGSLSKQNTINGTPNNGSSIIKWCSYSNPRPVQGIEGVLYIDIERKLISLWNGNMGKYIEFYSDLNNKSSKDEIKYSFNVVNNDFIITDSNGVIQEFHFPNTEELSNKINELTERIEKLEAVLN